MDDLPLHHPNDLFFKAIFSSVANTAAFLRHHLPPQLAACIPTDGIVIENSSFLDPTLSDLHSDLLLRITFPESDAILIVLLEHQSSQDPKLPLRLLGYIQRVLERFAREVAPATKLPPVLPFLISQSDRPWTAPIEIHDMLLFPAGLRELLLPYQPRLTIHVLDLFTTPYGSLGGTPDGVLALRALKAKPVHALLSDAVWDASVLEAVSSDALVSFLRYTFDAEDDPDAVIERTKEFRSETMNTTVMSAAQKLIERGRELGHAQGHAQGRDEGLTEGKCQGIRAAIVDALEMRFGPLPYDIRSLLEAPCSLDDLRTLLGDSIRCSSLEDFRCQRTSPPTC
jgi:hypothetical protein